MKTAVFCLCLLSTRAIAAQSTTQDVTTAMLRADSQIRLQLGVAIHRLSAELTKAAQNQAEYMARTGDFEHYGNNGTPGVRAARYDYHGVVQENIARGFREVDDVFQGWRGSPTHWDTIKSDYDEVGFGFAVANDGTKYWVALYGTTTTEDSTIAVALKRATRTKTFMLIRE